MRADYKHLLVVMPSWMGDIVMATPVLRSLRSAMPEAKIIATVRSGLEPILGGCPFLNGVETTTLRGPLGPILDARRLARTKPDTVLVLPNSFRAALFARFTGAPRRIGFSRDGRGALLTDRIRFTKQASPSSTLDDYVRLVESAFEISIDDRTPTLATTPADEEAADHILEGLEERMILFNPGANRPDKRWSTANFAKLADTLRERYQCTILVNGAPAESELVGELVSQAAPGVIDLTQRKSTLGALKAIVRRVALLVSNDTGPRHLAAAFGTPCVALFGPTDRRWTLLPDSREQHLVAEPFLTDDHVADEHPAACAIDRISVGDVLHAAESLLGENAPS